MITFRQGHLLIDRLLDFLHNSLKVTSFHIGGNHDLAGDILAVDGVRARGRADFSNLAERNLAAGHIHRDVRDCLHRGPELVIGLDREVEDPVALIDLGDWKTGQVNLHHIGEFRRGHPIFRQHSPLRNYLKLRSFDLLLHIEVHHSGDG